MLSKTDEEIRGKSFVFSLMKKIIGENETESAIQKVVFTKDKKGIVFDVLSQYDDLIAEKWFNTRSLELTPLTELPEIEADTSSGGGGGFGGGRAGGGGRFGNKRGGGGRKFGGGGGGRFGGDRNGGGGRFGGDRNGGDSNKRKFDAASSASQSKRVKFD